MGWFGPVGDWLTEKETDVAGKALGIPTADERRKSQQMINEQIKAYKDQTEITRQEINRKKGEEAVEKRRVEEKQIRALRRNYRSSGRGMLGSSGSAEQDMTTKLGG